MSNPSNPSSPANLGALYAAARVRVTELVANVDDTLPVPATPGWTVHDVVAHIRGIVEDGLAGNMDGAPGEQWTAAQVARGAAKTTAELLSEWTEQAPTFEQFLSSPDGAMVGNAVVDVHTHEADLRHALGLAAIAPPEFLDWVMQRFDPGFTEAVAAAGLAPVTVRATPFEWFRGRLGRRTEAEVGAYDWSGDPAPYLDIWFVFGRRTESLGESESVSGAQ